MSTAVMPSAMPVVLQPLREGRSRGKAVCAWIERHCVFTKGQWTGQPFRLLPWQRRFLYELYELQQAGTDAAGEPIYVRRYRRALLGVPKKNGKTELAAAIALYEINAGREPQPEAYVAANSEDQADLVFRAASEMVRLSPTLARIDQAFKGQIVVPSRVGTLTRLTSKAKTKDGMSPSLAIFDELHEFDDAGEYLYNVITNGTGARQEPLVLGITTAGYDIDTLCGRLYQYGMKVASGQIDDPRFLFRWYGATEDADYRDPATWAAANPSYGHIVQEAFYEEQLGTKHEGVFRRYFLNQWTATEAAWLPDGAWDACEDRTIELIDGAETLVAWDAALRKDSTAIVWGQQVDDRKPVRSKVWEAQPDPMTGRPDPNWRAPMAEIMDFIRDLATRYEVTAIGYDPWGVKESVQQLAAEGLPMVEVPQTNARMVPASGYLYELITDGVLAHNGDATFAQHMRNVVARNVRGGIRIDKDQRSRKPMDAGIAAAILAYLFDDREDEGSDSFGFIDMDGDDA